MRENLAISEYSSGENISEAAIREELSRILESPWFIQSGRLSWFLRFTVEATLAGKADPLKEYVIGTEVYDRKPPHHPSGDSIVRSEARRLRKKLTDYYASAGKDDAIFIYYRPGSYIPTFKQHGLRDDRSAMDRALDELFNEELGAQILDIPSEVRELDVEVVFEGTMRVQRPGSTSSPPTEIRKVVSMSLRISHRQ